MQVFIHVLLYPHAAEEPFPQVPPGKGLKSTLIWEYLSEKN